MTTGVDATFYVQVDPVWSPYTAGEVLVGAKATVLTQGRPQQPRGGSALVKLTLRLPVAAFQPLQPDTVIAVPADQIASQPIEVAVGDVGTEQ